LAVPGIASKPISRKNKDRYGVRRGNVGFMWRI
jgi:hypothetical protein